MSVAHLFALPGIAWLLIALFRRVQASPAAIIRVLGSVALAALTPAGLAALWVGAVAKPDDAMAEPPTKGDCRSATALAPLSALPPALLLAPIDMGPDILVQTGHAVTGTAHHRNAAGITAVLQAYMAPPDKARQIVGRLNGGRGAAYVITCSDLNEVKMYVKDAPHGLAAVLARGEIPAWLAPVPGHGPLKIYRVLPATKRSATPFMQ